ncbi:MAG: methyltransferase domain-containing protein [Bacteroidia bacterium]|nr:methyltransferase domain-containing protein [Bacteroidia bacterium]
MEGSRSKPILDPIILFNRHANRYADLYMDVSAYEASLHFLLQLLHPNQIHVLDLGCGPANLSGYLYRANPKFHIVGIDAAPSMVDLAKMQLPNGSFWVGDIRSLPPFTTSFDLVLLGFIAPYLSPSELRALLVELAGILKDGSLIYLSTMEAKQEKSAVVSNSMGEQTIQYFYSEQELLNLFRELSFETRHTLRIPIVHPEGKSDNDLVLILQKG